MNLATGRALPPIVLGVPGPLAHVVMAPDGGTVYVATMSGDVVPIDTATRTAEPPIRIGGVPTDVTDTLTYGCHVAGDDPPLVSSEHSRAGLFSPAEVPELTMPSGYKRSIMTWFGLIADGE